MSSRSHSGLLAVTVLLAAVPAAASIQQLGGGYALHDTNAWGDTCQQLRLHGKSVNMGGRLYVFGPKCPKAGTTAYNNGGNVLVPLKSKPTFEGAELVLDLGGGSVCRLSHTAGAFSCGR